MEPAASHAHPPARGHPRQPPLRQRRNRGRCPPRDRLLATVLKLRWSAHHNTLAYLFGVSPSTISSAIRETRHDLAGIGHHIPAGPIKATTTSALAALVGQEDPCKIE